MSQTSSVRPPDIAAWLVDLVSPYEQAESIAGDLLEEFSELASESGVTSARRWYWRQSAKTITHLVGAGLRVAPWRTAGVVLMGFLLLRVGYGWPEYLLVAVLRTQKPYSNAHVDAYMFFLTWGILVGRVLQPMIIGCLVAVAAKGREMAATVALGFVTGALTSLAFLNWVKHRPENAYLLSFFVSQFGSSVMIVIGGVIVREIRSAMLRRAAGV